MKWRTEKIKKSGSLIENEKNIYLDNLLSNFGLEYSKNKINIDLIFEFLQKCNSFCQKETEQSNMTSVHDKLLFFEDLPKEFDVVLRKYYSSRADPLFKTYSLSAELTQEELASYGVAV